MGKGKAPPQFGKGFDPNMKKPPGKGSGKKKAAGKKAPPFGKGGMPNC